METDVIIIGAGPAGIQAAMHVSRRKVGAVLIGKPANSASYGAEIENYFGVSSSKGSEMLKTGIKQAVSFGTEFLEENVVHSNRKGKTFTVRTETGKEINAKAVIVATGISRVKLGIPGEKEFVGKGVSYCSVCDCNFYKGKSVAVIGDDTEAALSADMMTKYASKVYWVTEGSSAAKVLIEKASMSGALIKNAKAKEIKGDSQVRTLVLDDGSELEVDGIFIELGAKSAADIVLDMDLMPELDDTIKVDSKCATKIPGLFACGDVTGKPWQMARAVGQGCIAGLSAADYVKGVK
ncbi:MAG: NAD(P)/FAD-dependent oxidoreductase [Candidatus Methanomethylophilaceae archaeon]|jgi:thioredoxin reductase (NADPH)